MKRVKTTFLACIAAMILTLFISASIFAVTPAAEINGTTYPSLGAAIAAVQNGQTIVLLRDIENEGAEGVIIDRDGVTFTIDMDDNFWVYNDRDSICTIVVVSGDVTFKNGYIANDGYMDEADAIALVVLTDATVTLEHMGVIAYDDYGCYVEGGHVNILSGLYYGYDDAVSLSCDELENWGTVDILSGYFGTDPATDEDDGCIYFSDYPENVSVDENAVAYPSDWKETPATEITVNCFKDIPAGKWYEEYVYELASMGIIGGKYSDIFDPQGKITRAEFAKIIAASYGIDWECYDYSSDFNDVDIEAWYNPYVNWAADNGIVNGKGNNLFAPNAPITREEMAVMLYRYVDLLEEDGFVLPTDQPWIDFSDVGQIAPWALDAVDMMIEAGIINGYGDNTFRPQNTATRAETAKMVAIFLRSLVEQTV